MEYIQHHVASKPLDLDTRVPDKQFPAGLATVIARALEKKPEDRYQSAADFARALQAFVPGHTGLSDVIPPPPAQPVQPQAASVPSADSSSLPTAPVDQKSRGPGLAVMLGVAAACLVLGVVLAVAFMQFMGK